MLTLFSSFVPLSEVDNRKNENDALHEGGERRVVFVFIEEHVS